MGASHSIGEYLIRRLQEHGIRHVFGVPGDYVLGFYGQLDRSDLQIINTCDEQGAGFAADAYARAQGMGAVCVTYCVGGLKIANTTAQAYAEKSPVVVISGSPGMGERAKNPMLHHMVRDFDTQFHVFQQLTVAATVLRDAQSAFAEIDRVLAAARRYKQPVYIEIPRDMVAVPGVATHAHAEPVEASDPNCLREAIHEAAAMIGRAERPVILAGVELHRFGLQEDLLRLVEQTNIPVAATILSKSVVSDHHPRYLGVYEGAMGKEDVRDYIEGGDCVILLGAFMTDIDLGLCTARLDPARSISVTSEKASIRYHYYQDVRLQDFLAGLERAGLRRREPERIPHPEPPPPFHVAPGAPVTVERLFQAINAAIYEETVVLADPGDALFAGLDLFIDRGTHFMAPAYYTSLGFAVPGALGAQLARPETRPLVLVGDGAFQMTGMELSTIARFGLTPILLVLNNRGYGTERPMTDGSFNDIGLWDHSRLPEVLGAGRGYRVETEEQLDDALRAARADTSGFSILDVHLAPDDLSPALRRLTRALAQRVHPGHGP
jgi:indolepyruvate decarboxylase